MCRRKALRRVCVACKAAVPKKAVKNHNRSCGRAVPPTQPSPTQLPLAPSPPPLLPPAPPHCASGLAAVSWIDPLVCPAADRGAGFECVADTLGMDIGAILDERDLRDRAAQAAADRYTPPVWGACPSSPGAAEAGLRAALGDIYMEHNDIDASIDLAAHARSSAAAGDAAADSAPLQGARTKEKRRKRPRRRCSLVLDEAECSSSATTSGSSSATTSGSELSGSELDLGCDSDGIEAYFAG